jgi:predicted DNA-binding transcriptional regulator AlpA
MPAAVPVMPMLTVREVAGRLGIVPASVWRGVAEGRIPKPLYPAPRSPRWRWDEVAVAMERTRAMPATAMLARREASRSARLSGQAA